MNINELYKLAINGGKNEEKQLLNKIDDIFSVLVELRIRNRQETEEIVQDILMVVAEKYRSVKIEISFSSWAYRIMENMLLHYYRKQKTQKVSLTQPIGDLHVQSNNSPDLILMRQLKKCLKQLNSANNRYARIINLKHLGYSTEEMCQKLKISKNNACVILSRARSLLKRCLEKGDIK